MRTGWLFALIPAVLLAATCSREPTPPPKVPAAATTAPPPAATPPPAMPAPAPAVFTDAELDQMLAPIALYPDPLLAQVLMASTYPGDVADAAAWSRAHRDAKGDEAVKMVANQPWDPSVQSLVAFPQALATMGQDPGWVQRVGDAFLAQPDRVMDSVQRLRNQAQAAGNLASNEYQTVHVQPAEPIASGAVEQGARTSTIVIEPSDPEVVYVPSYDPSVAYGTWAYPSYPPVYYPPSPYYYPGYYPGSALAAGLMWGAGVAITNSLWGGLDWNNDDIDINVNQYNNLNSNRQLNANQNNWRHNSLNRDGVPYRDGGNREQYGRRLDGADARQSFRGEDAQRSQARQQARSSMERRGMDTPARSNREARDRAAQAGPGADRSAQRAAGNRTNRQSRPNNQARNDARRQSASRQSPRNNAFDGARQPQSSRDAQRRGQSSRSSANRSGGSRSSGGRQVQRQSRAPQRQGGSSRQGSRR